MVPTGTAICDKKGLVAIKFYNSDETETVPIISAGVPVAPWDGDSVLILKSIPTLFAVIVTLEVEVVEVPVPNKSTEIEFPVDNVTV